MSLVLHIVRKDTRHLFPEILIALALTAAFAAAAPVQWRANPMSMDTGSGIFYLLAPLLRIQLPIIWLVLISRLVHDESLVGDRQFWITRPYTWPTLLAAKLLFVLVFLYLPFFLMQIYLLHHAGLAIGPALPDLFRYELRLTLIFFLPFLAIATVTSNFARLSLSVLVALPYLIGVFVLGGRILGRRMPPPQLLTVCEILFFAALTAILLFQYATRRTRVSRFALAGVPLLLLLFVLIAPAKSLIDHAYVPVTGDAAPRLVFNPDPLRQEPGSGQPLSIDDVVFLSLPLQRPGMPPGVRYKAKGIAVTIDTAQGFHWSSPYLENGTDLYAGSSYANIDFSLPADVFRRIRDTPVDLHLRIAAAIYTTGSPRITTAAIPGFAAPANGLCPVDSEGVITSCRYALRLPAPIDVAADVSPRPCGIVPGQRPGTSAIITESNIAKNFIGSDETDHLSFDFDPVTTTPLNLALLQATPNPNTFQPGYLCPGTPVTFTPHYLDRPAQISAEFHNLILAPYAKRQTLRGRILPNP